MTTVIYAHFLFVCIMMMSKSKTEPCYRIVASFIVSVILHAAMCERYGVLLTDSSCYCCH